MPVAKMSDRINEPMARWLYSEQMKKIVVWFDGC